MRLIFRNILPVLIVLSTSTVFGQEFTKAEITRHRIKSVIHMDPNGRMKKVSHYNEHGDLVSIGVAGPAGLVKNKELIYNDQKLLTEEKNFNPIGNVHFTHRFTYDSKHKLIKKESLDSDQKVVSTWTYEYDNNGNLVKETQQSRTEGNYVTRYKYQKGRIVEEELTNDALGKEEKVTFSYNDKGQLVEQKIRSYFTNNIITIVFTYDSKGRLIKQEDRTENRKDGETIFEYDVNGLLERQTVHSVADNLTDTTTYRFEYF